MKKITSHPIIKNGHNIVLALASILLIAVLFYAAFFVSDTNKVKAGVTHNVSGWAWSADNDSNDDGVFDSLDKEIGGVGWISFNCTNTSSCATVDYGVNVDIDGNLSGYAWYGWEDSDGSTVGGWISFNVSDLSGCPSGACEAKLVGNNLQGWARALSYGDEWDGWISLSGTADDGFNYGPQLDGSNNFIGYAWDASDISGKQIGIGWIDFSPPLYGGVVIGPQPTYVCTSIPSNTLPTCTGDYTGLSADTPSTVVTSCSAPKCEYTCDSGYEKNGNSCVLISGGTTQCSDTIDNDTDTRIDDEDPGCYSAYPGCVYDPNDDDETDALPQCSNCIDDDGDGFADYPNDTGCSSADDDREQNIGFEEF